MKILVGYDGTNVAKEAVLLAQKHAKIFDGEIEVVTAMPQNHKLGYEEIQGAENKLEREMRNLFQENTIPYKEHLVVAKQSAGEELVEFADRNQIDEIIIGVRQRSKVGKFVFGSTAQYVILHAPCPVLTIK
jgi:nucleotide-binding universal stress UspA family protein